MTGSQTKTLGWALEAPDGKIPNIIERMIWDSETFDQFRSKCIYAFNDPEMLIEQTSWTKTDRAVIVHFGDGRKFNVSC